MSQYKRVVKRDEVSEIAKLIIECVRKEHERAMGWFRRRKNFSRYVKVYW